MDLASTPDLRLSESLLSNTSAAANASDDVVLLPPVIDKSISIIMIVVLTISMVSMGCTMEVSKIKSHMVKPKGVAIAVVAQYGIMPLAAFSLAKAFQLSEIRAVVVLICGCCPGGSLSNILALVIKGDMNLSIVMTCCSTLLALAMMPLLLLLYCQGFPNVQKSVPYISIIVSLVTLLIPCTVGILINYYRPQHARIIQKIAVPLMTTAVVVVGILTTVSVGSSILTVLSPSLMAVCALMPLLGYTLGYLLSSLAGLSQRERRTVSMETGCQNIQLCSTILKTAFSPALIGPLFMFPFMFAAFQLLEAAVIVVLFRCHHRFATQKEGRYHPAHTEAGGSVPEPQEDMKAVSFSTSEDSR